jgi:diaminopimelate decarboxylase
MPLSTDRVRELVRDVGTPCYVYDLAEVRAAAARLAGALPGGARIHYSLKANPHPDVVRTCLDVGLGVEVSSEGEWAAVPPGTPPGSVIYSGPGKTGPLLGEFARRWGGYVTVESVRELAEVRRVGGFAGILLRVNLTQDTAGSSLTMSGRASQFGLDDTDVLRDWAELDLGAGDIAGFQFFAMSNQPKAGVLADAARGALGFVADCAGRHGFRPRLLDLGGGFAAPFGRAAPRERTDLAGLRPALTEALAATPAAASATLVFESGRYLTAGAGVLYATVLDVKTSKGRQFVVLDAGVHCVGGLQASGRTLPTPLDVVPLGAGPGEAGPVTVTGPLCTPFDVLNRETALAVAPGDLVAIPNVGAYGLSASAVGFLSRPLPAEVVVDGSRLVGVSRLTMTRSSGG